MRVFPRTRRARWLGLASAVAVAAAGVTAAAVQPASAASAATVSVNAGQSRAPFSAVAVGTNVAVYDGNMNDGNIPGLLKSGGIGAVRYPGGSYADIYHWQTNTTDGGYVAPNTSFDTATNMSYDASIPAGGNVQFGFQGTWTSNDANPTSFTLNAAPCAAG
jgi:cellulose binding protein with CBM2 domain